MAGATLMEQQGLQRAIQLAIEKEDRALGRIVGNVNSITTYVASCRIGRKYSELKSTNLNAFIATVKEMQEQFPHMKITIFEHVVKKPLAT